MYWRLFIIPLQYQQIHLQAKVLNLFDASTLAKSANKKIRVSMIAPQNRDMCYKHWDKITSKQTK